MTETNFFDERTQLLQPQGRPGCPTTVTAPDVHAGATRQARCAAPIRGHTKPSFFIVGAPRCGTTAMSKYLGKHPEICFSRPCEPHYFTDIPAGSALEELQSHYLERFFSHCANDHKAIGEGSVSYLYSPDAISHALRVNPRAKFIVMLRNPLEMVPSYHLRLLWNLDEDVEDFPTAWALQAPRRQGHKVPRTCRDPRLLQYAELAKFGDLLERLYQLIGRDNCFVIVFDDFVAHTRTVYQQVLRFLNIDDDGRTQFPPKAASRRHKLRWLHQLLYRPPTNVAKFVEGLEERKNQQRKNQSMVKRWRKRLIRMNTIRRGPAPLSGEMRELLIGSFTDDIEKLSYLLGRNVSHWYKHGCAPQIFPDRTVALV